MLKRLLLITASSSFLLLGSAASAQTISEAQMRAANLARMQAELINGGVNQYSPAACMHQGGGGSCLIATTDQGFRFRFLGGSTGWLARRDPPTVETVVLVSRDGRSSTIEYNGPIRTGSKP